MRLLTRVCGNFMGLNYQLGINIHRDVSSVCVNFVREIRDRSLFVSDFDLSELN